MINLTEKLYLVCFVQRLIVYNLQNANYVREGDDREEIIKSDTNVSEEWAIFGRILDRLLFMSYIVVYATMMLSFLP